MLELILSDEPDTLKMGAAIMHAINKIESDEVEIHLSGNLGAGKTTLVRGILQSTGWKGPVTSPSYTLCEEYEFDSQLFLHVDLYRISESEDVEILDLDRKITKQKIIFIEWPENLLASRTSHLIIELIHLDHKRQVRVKSGITEIESLIKAHYEQT
ncbi:MAG: tRNA (adenosine(37)-N6)-threonylcarbamoyltransferase complex ATPase subunit type 1 TsaE [SAR86 cluster bacterium]|jgi:tRNA threonylcarbamoyladenosine biosynthesis protein TsaE|nr:tRNA (adenosine(37)-N6)-threonylcarbamoyltransferase complex ATPase subunit type 1 TsaE [SAR86 cluster bacterium]MBT3674207.1 tRNA (adenosine(37)-N6)-threonylcarbamoyltransferase complex ATPase subunit type 1 TsaE [Pseudomonadota bacterium]MDA9021685.1 tRNA (adenosine(37)-N6)-threonylcarbamoyltransferase complex ATPase subunit type 1 TsaE [Gammaproteobacteria bacterium]MDA9027814.1 tRNA (adenosine(37)-N6)-threonylcarbamoyltransferase complex ATPase subunit type 1 TsaE [Gammaproteobacteria bac|tara:strand:+ start:69 stop:539 length:471 start_codon:yes stop_codon:yes gene_type:complete